MGEDTAWAVPTLGSSHLSLFPDAGCTEVFAITVSHPSAHSAPALTKVLSLPALSYAS